MVHTAVHVAKAARVACRTRSAQKRLNLGFIATAYLPLLGSLDFVE
jgi:hypothetical protein